MANQQDPKKAARKLQQTKALNRIEREQRRDAGNDSKKTRDGGTKRRLWR